MRKGLEFIGIARERICKYQLIDINGERFYITGKKVMRNANELAFSLDEYALLARLFSGETLEADAIVRMFERTVERLEANAPRLCLQLKLSSLHGKFAEPERLCQVSALKDVVVIASAQTDMINLSGIGGVKCAGYMQPTFSKELTSQSIVFIDQSVTGMFERRQRLEL